MKSHVSSRRDVPVSLIRALWAVLVLLVFLGVVAAALRGVYVDDLATRFDPQRRQIMDALRRDDPYARERPAELASLDGRYASHRLVILLHILPGGLFLLLAPLQFSATIRTRHIQLHRWSGRILLPAAIVSVVAALYFGILLPYGGLGETLAIALFGGLFLLAVGRAFLAIRRHQVARHREWMIRVFAIAIAISTVRVIAMVLDIALTPAGFRPRDLFVISLWAGWIVTIGVAEFWIRYTRPGHPVRSSNIA